MKLFRCSQFSAFDSEYVILLFFYHKATSTSDFTCILFLALVFFVRTFCVLFLRPVEEEVTNAKTSKDEEGFKSKGPQLSRKNSSKNLVSNF